MVAALACFVISASIVSPAVGGPSIGSVAKKAAKALKTGKKAKKAANAASGAAGTAQASADAAQATANTAQSAASNHTHSTVQAFNQATVTTAGGDVGYGSVNCPAGTVATGGGEEYVTGIATVEMGFVGTTAYYVLVDNFNYSPTSQVRVQVACTAGTGTPRTARVKPAKVEETVAEMAAELEASHREAR